MHLQCLAVQHLICAADLYRCIRCMHRVMVPWLALLLGAVPHQLLLLGLFISALLLCWVAIVLEEVSAVVAPDSASASAVVVTVLMP